MLRAMSCSSSLTSSTGSKAARSLGVVLACANPGLPRKKHLQLAYLFLVCSAFFFNVVLFCFYRLTALSAEFTLAKLCVVLLSARFSCVFRAWMVPNCLTVSNTLAASILAVAFTVPCKLSCGSKTVFCKWNMTHQVRLCPCNIFFY